MASETRSFDTEVGRILQIVANSLYSNKEIFLRELISNASDACDRLRYEAITNPELTATDNDFRVVISIDADTGILTIEDNGIGMNKDSLIQDLGTIARSGSSHFLEKLSGDQQKDLALIGQFGVGFYSVFTVADKVEVVSKRAGEDTAWIWTSDGAGQYTIGGSERESRGTSIKLHLKETEKEYLEPLRLRNIVSTYSDHISLPIELVSAEKTEVINKASALWARPRSDIKKEQYTEFYRHIGRVFDDPWLTIHWRAEGTIEYTGLIFIPSTRPFDLFTADRTHRVKLYVKRVFITENCEELIPAWLRFLRGLIDSEDIPLNVSRELLQANPMVNRIRKAVVTRVLGDLQKKADEDPNSFDEFWGNFGPVLKEGIYEDPENRDSILKIARFKSTEHEGMCTLDDYVGRMKPGQDAIYYITGDSEETLVKSPQLEGFRSRGVEVLLLTDPVDDFWLPAVGEWQDKPFKSATRGGADFSAMSKDKGEDSGKDKIDDSEDQIPVEISSLISLIKLELGETIKDVRASSRLTDSPVCLIADDGDIDINLERLLRQHRQIHEQVPRVLEINPNHPVIVALSESIGKKGSGAAVTDMAWLLLDQARILEGEPLPDPSAFSRRFNALLEKSVLE